MNRFIYKILIFFFLFSSSVIANTNNIAFIDIDYIIKNSNVGKEALNKIKALDQTNINKLKERNKEIKEKVFKKIGPIVSKYMEKNSIDIVFDTKNMFMGNSKSDITKEILEEIDKSLK